MRKLRVLDLFSGIGGFSLGLERSGGFETVAFCEIEPFPRRVLAKHWPNVPIFEDVRKLKGHDIGPVDVICGGYPCQPFSTAGKRQGQADDRHLWPEFRRLVAELRPTWVIGENVAGHISMGLDDVLADLEAEGYAARTFVIPACAVGASHRRDRVWTVAHTELRDGQPSEVKRPGIRAEAFGQWADIIACGASDKSETVAHAESVGRSEGNADTERMHGRDETEGNRRRSAVNGNISTSAHVAHANDKRSQGRAKAGNSEGERQRGNEQPERRRDDQGSAWRSEPRLGGMADGFSCWLDEPRERVKVGVKDRAPRLKALGNAVHPDIPMMLGRAIMQAEGLCE